MKRIICLLLCLALAAGFSSAFAMEQAEPSLFELMQGFEWSFSSGVGAWSTDLRILADGSFSGEFHDSEMGEAADEYPQGTVYCCSFTGHLSPAGPEDENPRKIRVDSLKEDESQEAESVSEGIRFVRTGPYGISEGDVMLLYEPGTPVDVLSEDMQFWAHLMEYEEPSSVLQNWFLMSEKNESGFVGYEVIEDVSMANPWTDMSEEELKAVSGLSFRVPEGAVDPVFRWLAGEGLAEMQYTADSDSFCFRAQATALEDGQFAEISGMYFAWENEEEITVCGCPGTIGMAQTGSEDWVERCLWYDSAAGIMYSLSVATTDPDGLDLAAVAEQICGAPEA